MSSNAIILFSPGPIDGYPPVQYQARLFADCGYAVEVVTSPLSYALKAPKFSYPGVRVTSIEAAQAFSGRALRGIAYIRALTAARRRAGREATEICYDPIGVFYSDCSPLKPRWRVAHFHELLQYPENFLERRLRRAIHKFDLVVVPDEHRALRTAADLDLSVLPLVIENYPLRAEVPLSTSSASSDRFEVIYCGSLGFDQKLDVAIRSAKYWPDGVSLIIIGNHATGPARALIELGESVGVSDRIEFLGWMDTHSAELRLSKANLGIGLLSLDSAQFQTALGASNKRYQYMKAGLPQIGDRNPGVVDLIEGNRVGMCVGSHDPQELAAVVKAYVSDPARCKFEGGRAFAKHQEIYNYELVFDRLLNRLREFL
jgi:glycosyltransferase involved in cell wall biosynthesis